jgi:hypothetical protein
MRVLPQLALQRRTCSRPTRGPPSPWLCSLRGTETAVSRFTRYLVRVHVPNPRTKFDSPTTLGPTTNGPELSTVTATASARCAAPACADRAQDYIPAQRPVGHRGGLDCAAPHSPSSHRMHCPSLASVLFMLRPRLPPAPSFLPPPAPKTAFVFGWPCSRPIKTRIAPRQLILGTFC